MVLVAMELESSLTGTPESVELGTLGMFSTVCSVTRLDARLSGARARLRLGSICVSLLERIMGSSSSRVFADLYGWFLIRELPGTRTLVHVVPIERKFTASDVPKSEVQARSTSPGASRPLMGDPAVPCFPDKPADHRPHWGRSSGDARPQGGLGGGIGARDCQRVRSPQCCPCIYCEVI